MSFVCERQNYLDFLKGIAIYFVVFAHFDLYPPLKNVIYTFHMPLFMFLAGCTFFYSSSKYPIKTFKELSCFLNKKASALLVPYLFFVLFFNIIINYKNGIMNNIEAFILDFKQLQSLWFLPVLFGIETLFSFVLVVINNKKMQMNLSLIIEGVITIFFSCFLLLLSRKICFEVFRKMAIYIIPFFIGYAIEKYEIIKKICTSELLCSLAIIISFLLIPRYNVDDKSIFVLVVRLLVGCFISILLYKVFENGVTDYSGGGGKCIVQIGRHTMVIYLFHPYIAHLFINKDINIIGISIAYYTIVSFLTMIFCIFLELLLLNSSRIISFLVLGKKININR